MNQTHIDWLSFRTQGSLNDVVPALAEVYGLKVDVQHRNGGWMGHEHSADIKVGNMGVGMLAYGGTTMRGWMNVQITGRGCEWVSDWDNAVNVLKRLPDRQYKRADIALDTFHGESSHDKVMKVPNHCAQAMVAARMVTRAWLLLLDAKLVWPAIDLS